MGSDDGASSVATTARGLRDYQRMFGLTDEDLTRFSFLDCAAGASSFGAEARRKGATVISVDPVYDEDAEQIRAKVDRNLTGASRWLNANSAVDWSYLGSPSEYVSRCRRNLDQFLDDLGRNPRAYVAAGLPQLPLSDDAVDIALCANYLFAYPDVASVGAVVAGIRELVRVARHCVLIHPLQSRTGEQTPQVADVFDRLATSKLVATVYPAEGSWLRNAETLRVTVADTTSQEKAHHR